MERVGQDGTSAQQQNNHTFNNTIAYQQHCCADEAAARIALLDSHLASDQNCAYVGELMKN